MSNQNIKVNPDGTISPIDPTKPASFTTDTPPSTLPSDIDPYLEVIAMFDSVHLPAAQRKAILAWHHKQVASGLKELLDELPKKWDQDYSGESAAYNEALDEVRALILKKLEE